MRNARTGLGCYRGAMPVRQASPRPGERIRTQTRLLPAEHRRLVWASRVAGLSVARFTARAIEKECRIVLAEHPVAPMDLRPELDELPNFY